MLVLNQTKGLVEGANALLKGDTVVVTALSFDDARGQARAGKVTRATNASRGYLLIASADVPVKRTAVLVKAMPFQMDTTGASAGDPVYVGADGAPSLVDAGTAPTCGSVVTVGTVAAGGAVMLTAPGTVTN